MAGKFYEDFEVGEVIDSPESYEITRDNLHAFAAEFDPQPMHLDDRAAQDSIFGTLTASGWQTLSATMRLMVRSPLFECGLVVGVGVDRSRWVRPVLPGQRLSATAEVTAKRPSKTHAERGYLTLDVTTSADGTVVATQVWNVLLPRRPSRSRA